MSILDIIEVFSDLLVISDKQAGPKRPKIYILFYVLLLPSIFWFAIEIRSVTALASPILFLGIFTLIGLILTIGTVIVIYKLELIEELRKKDFVTILIPVTLLTLCIASSVNRTYEIMFYK
ncbi:hypothetical protein SAMN05660236_5280 [Ohtaekwangia koreensis]|uniref:Uncharacterized protein n=1 Tax=Ohtaekwangia koreensis TaxID=688867 RepID=A0A1T5MFN3_9BACT|nr:hypothetical protein SAMN05660236_5280 [Ohtaekwangia koreensis]